MNLRIGDRITTGEFKKPVFIFRALYRITLWIYNKRHIALRKFKVTKVMSDTTVEIRPISKTGFGEAGGTGYGV